MVTLPRTPRAQSMLQRTKQPSPLTFPTLNMRAFKGKKEDLPNLHGKLIFNEVDNKNQVFQMSHMY